jgi:hypothetical protein
VLMAGRERFGALERVFTGAEMRAHDDHRPAVATTTARTTASDDPPFGMAVDSHGADSRLHHPDLLFVADWGHCAVYLPLVPFATRRLEAILDGYARHKDVRVVLYLQAEPVIGRAIERTAERLDLSDLVRVHSVRAPTHCAVSIIAVTSTGSGPESALGRDGQAQCLAFSGYRSGCSIVSIDRSTSRSG